MTTVTNAAANLEALLVKGPDTALLRYSLGNEYLKQGDLDRAIEHLAGATRLDPRYSAAWKLHGKALQAAGRAAEAIAILEQGIQVAEERGDIQAAKEMGVFRRRAQKELEAAQ
ncbi:MAG: tetratricopeptide repeat protein [Gammaproteobacteria bacterium]|jgi:tetratricopeptide (TPR) repeat protein|nr:tetratricopeptide repeat protein [Gammaproteobacteria bacterium]